MSEQASGREPQQLVEIRQDLCANVYGTAPCTAALGVTGAVKCYNTLRTCQDAANYVLGDPRSLWFCKPLARLPSDRHVVPSVLSIGATPTEINIGGGSRDRGPLGTRSVVTVTFQDAPHPDTAVDPYLAGRPFDPLARSTFWAKWLARNPFHVNRRLAIYDGYVGQAPEAMVRREFLIDRIEGPDSSGRVRVVAKDPLKLADDNRAQAPAASTAELVEDLAAGATGFEAFPAEDDGYPASGTVRIGDEVMTYASCTIDTDGLATFTGVVRGTDGTAAEEHDAEDRVQRCLRFEARRVWEVAAELLLDFAALPASFIDTAAWDAEGEVWLAQFDVSTLVTEPTGVSALLGELCEQALFNIWWDERAQLVRLRAIRPPLEGTTALNERDHFIADSLSLSVDPDQRVSQVWIYWRPRDPTKGLTEENNYARLRIRTELEAEREIEYGDARIRKVFARWLTNEGQVVSLAVRMLQRFRDPPRFLQFRLDAKDRDLWTGGVVDAETGLTVDATGQVLAEQWEVIRAEETQSGELAAYRAQESAFGGRRFIYWMAEDAPDYPDSAPAERQPGFWWADADGKMSDGSDGFVWS